MSRIAKDPVVVPDSVNITIEGKTINFKGPKGEMTLEVHDSVSSLRKKILYKLNGKKMKKEQWLAL